MKKIFKVLIKTFNDQGRKETTQMTAQAVRIFGSILITISGVLLFLDKILKVIGIEGSNTFGFSNYSNFIWVFTQSIAPIFMIIGFLLRPYFLSILIPLYCYTIQIIWVFHIYHFDDIFLQTYAIGTCILFLILFFFIKWVWITIRKQDIENKQFIEYTNAFIVEANKHLIQN